jgi:N-acetyl-gamma-glutamyl-phosphate reductase
MVHHDPARLGQTVYGLPELFRDQIRQSQLVANPGCYPTSAILALAPLLKAGLIEPRDIIVDSKSGVSGAGRSPKLTTHFPECNESVSAYNVGRHRHTPEIEQILGRACGKSVSVIFTPHLIPMDRGILTTIYARPTGDVQEETLLAALSDYYSQESFVRVVKHLPATKDTVGTNFCDVTVRRVRDRVVAISCLDNLVKGAAGAAVQNFNLMYGYPETTALL